MVIKKIVRKKINSRETYRYKINIVLAALALILLIVLTAHLFTQNSVKQSNIKEIKLEAKILPKKMKNVLEIASPTATFRVPILMFHYIEYVKDKQDKIRKSLNTTPFIFEQEILTLKDDGYTFMTMSELGDVLNGKNKLPTKPILLTFDDGYRDFYTDAYPLLKKYSVKATEYVNPGFLGGSNYMTQAQLEEVAKNKLIEIGAHTVHHVYLKGMKHDTAQKEIVDSKIMLENELHKPVVSFAYPYGAFDEQAVLLAKEAGFTTAVSTVPGINVNQVNRFYIFRLRGGGRTGQNLLDFLNLSQFRPF